MNADTGTVLGAGDRWMAFVPSPNGSPSRGRNHPVQSEGKLLGQGPRPGLGGSRGGAWGRLLALDGLGQEAGVYVEPF